MGATWWRWEDLVLRELYSQVSYEALATILGRTPSAIRSRAKVLRLRRTARRSWTEAEIKQLRALYPDKATADIARRLNRLVGGVYQKALKIGLHKSEEYLASPAACRLRRGDNVGWAHRFQKGQVPHNKGLRRPGWAPGRMAETQFQKGQRSGIAARNWRPVGTILADPEGYRRIKVREATPGEASGFGNTKVWALLNRYVWEQHNGPIPAGHLVVFKDHDRANCAIGNLELITLAENMRRNNIHRYPPALKDTIRASWKLRKAIRKKSQASAEQQGAGLKTPTLGAFHAEEFVG